MGCLCGKLTDGDRALPTDAAPHMTFPSSKPVAVHRRPPSLLVPPPSNPAAPCRLLTRYSVDDSPAWPAWLSCAAGDALAGWPPRRADSFRKLEKIGSGTYSNVYKARDLVTGRVVALKKVRLESVHSKETVQFMVREIALRRRLDHPNLPLPHL